VVDLPVIQPEVTQYNVFTCKCGKCGKHIRAAIPTEAEKGFGPRLMGFITMLSGEAGVTKRKICAIVTHLGIKISLGSICNIHRIASEILKEPYEAIRDFVLSQGNVNADESSWRLKSKRYWVWIGATPQAAFFKIDPSRSQKAFNRIFYGFQNTLSTDRYGAYNCHEGTKQICLAHIDRDFAKISEREGADGALGRILCDELGTIFKVWKQFRAQGLTRSALQEQAEKHIENIRGGLTVLASANGISSKSAAVAKDLLKRFPSMWIFLYEEGVEPTNNLAERGLRSVVIQRKISIGSQSEWGLAFTERLHTIVYTCKQNAKNIFEFLTELFRAHIRGVPAPPVFAS
jgi:hypothetical protein